MGKMVLPVSKAVLEMEIQLPPGSLSFLRCLWWLEHNHHVMRKSRLHPVATCCSG